MALTREQRRNAAHDVLSTVGWQDVLRPDLYRLRERLRSATVAASLGQPHEYGDTNPIALAAMAWATEQILGTIEKIVGDGAPPVGETLADVLDERLREQREQR